MSLEITTGLGNDRKVVARSQNLRGILTYARKHCAAHVSCSRRSDGSAFVYVRFDDYAECRTEFASYGVAIGFFRARRSWGLTEVHCSPSLTSFVKLCQ